MPYTIRIQSTAMIHAPGMFDYLRRMLRGGKAKERVVARQALAEFGLAPCVVAAIERGDACAETDPEDTLRGRLLLTVASALREEQDAYAAAFMAKQRAPIEA